MFLPIPRSFCPVSPLPLIRGFELSQVSMESLPSAAVGTQRVERGEALSLALWALLPEGPEVGA